MADPTSAVALAHNASPERMVSVIKSAEALVLGAPIALDVATGKSEFMDDAAGLIPIGVSVNPSGGNADNLTGNAGGTNIVTTRGGIVLENKTVTGASAITDRFKLVYMTDGGTYTLTRPTVGMPVGYVWQWSSGTTCHVYIFTPTEALMFSYLVLKETVLVAVIPVSAFGASAGDLLTNIPQHQHYTIDSVFAVCVGFDAGVIAGAKDLNFEINAANVTGGVISLGFADCDATGDLGTQVAGSAITAANEVHIGDTLSLEMTAGTAFTADQTAAFAIFMTRTILPGA